MTPPKRAQGQPVTIFLDREVRCFYCRTDDLWGKPFFRQGQHHYGVKLTPEIVGKCIITLNGRDVTNQTVEALAGSDGWVATFVTSAEGKRVVCKHGQASGDDHALVEKQFGNVIVRVNAGAESR